MVRLFSIFISLFLLVLQVQSYGQNSKVPDAEFDSMYVYISTRLSAENNDSAFIAATSLLSKADDVLHKLKVLMLLATLYDRKGDAINAINFANQAYQLSTEINNKEWLLRINGFMSSAYRKVDLNKYGKKHLDEAFNLSKQLKLPLFQSFSLQEKAIYSMGDKDFEQALRDLNESIHILENSGQKANLNAFFWATNAQLLGICYFNLGRLEESKTQFTAALDSVKNMETELKGFCYWGLAKIAIKQGELLKTDSLIIQAEKYSKGSQNFELQLILAELNTEYYTIIGDSTMILKSQRDLIAIKERQKNYTSEVVNNIIDDVDTEIASSNGRSRQLLWISIGAAFILLLGIWLLNLYRIKKQKKTYERIISKLLTNRQYLVSEFAQKTPDAYVSEEINIVDDHQMESLANMDTYGDDPNDQKVNDTAGLDKESLKKENAQAWKKNIISDEYKKLLQEKLTEFEEGNYYLAPNLTLTGLASEFKINTKYLSVFISEYKGTDFNNYINRLRISYIIQKLHSDPTYREYKIAYLAEESGFSSHAKFATVFKEILGISPSIFIKNLQEK